MKEIFKLIAESGRTDLMEEWYKIEKKLEVLEIINKKMVDILYFMNCKTLKEYNDDVLASYAYEEVDAKQRMLTKEEFDLLKNWLRRK